MSEREILSAIRAIASDVRVMDSKVSVSSVREETMIRAIDKQTEIIGMLCGQMAKIIEWTQTPPETNLGEAMRELGASVRGVEESLVYISTEVRAVPRRTVEELAKQPV